MPSRQSKAWFAPKRYGYGSSWPIAWQGWAAMIVLFVAIAIALVELTGAVRFLSMVLIVAIFGLVCSLKTEGGWR